jgi:hypothetical protein
MEKIPQKHRWKELNSVYWFIVKQRKNKKNTAPREESAEYPGYMPEIQHKQAYQQKDGCTHRLANTGRGGGQ